jgi:hypothetical protein
MADNFDMKQFLMENKLGAYSRLKENEEQLNEYEVTYEYGSDGGCYRVDDEGNYDEVDDSMCKKYAGQGVREEKDKSRIAPFFDVKSDRIRMTNDIKDKLVNNIDWLSNGEQFVRPKDANSEWNWLLPTTNMTPEQVGEINKVLGIKEDMGKDLEDTEAAKQMDFLAEKDKVKEALTPEMFERMDALTSHNAQIAMIKAAEIMMNELTEEGFEVLDIREYFTQLIANDI